MSAYLVGLDTLHYRLLNVDGAVKFIDTNIRKHDKCDRNLSGSFVGFANDSNVLDERMFPDVAFKFRGTNLEPLCPWFRDPASKDRLETGRTLHFIIDLIRSTMKMFPLSSISTSSPVLESNLGS